MKFLRTASTRRLLATFAGAAVAIAAGTAIAVAAAGSGEVPRATPLARAIRDALGAPQVSGITARVTFTNHLIDASNIQGSDPILSGASGRLWLSSDHRLRLELQADNGDAQAVLDNGSFWVYDPSANTVYEGKLPSQSGAKDTGKQASLPSIAQIQSDIANAGRSANVSKAVPSDVAGQPAYTVRVSPKHDGGLLGAGQLAWDAVRGVPLRIAVYAKGDSSPVLELKATDISYGRVRASVFRISPPTGAKVVKVLVQAGQSGPAAAADRRAGEVARHRKAHPEVTGAAAVARHLPFRLVAPSKLVGLPRHSVSLLDWGGSPAALVSYGQNLGGVAVVEQTVGSTKASTPSTGGEHRGLSLPTVSINGATGQELDTALGTAVRFMRAGVSYTVIGSVPAAAADAAARAL